MYTPPVDNAQGRCLADGKFAGTLLLPSVWVVAIFGGHQTWSSPTQCAAPTWSHVSPQRLQAHKLLPHGVPAIVQNDVEPRHPCTLTARQRHAWGNTDHTGDGGSEDHKWLDSRAHTHHECTLTQRQTCSRDLVRHPLKERDIRLVSKVERDAQPGGVLHLQDSRRRDTSGACATPSVLAHNPSAALLYS